MIGKCVHCNTVWDEDHSPGTNATCDNCQNDLHSCVNCKLYDRRTDSCTDPITEPVRDSSKRNFCDTFLFGVETGNTKRGPSRSEEARKNLNALFKNL